MAVKAKGRSAAGPSLRERIIDAAVETAEHTGWGNLRLRRVAAELGVSVAEVRLHFRDLDAVADGWFRRAEDAMLAPVGRGFAVLPGRQRLYRLMQRWFDALAGHRQVTGEMLATKLYLSHPHHWVPMIFNLSRLVQWLRDAAGLDADGRRRQLEEIGLSALFLATLAVWLADKSPGQERTRRFLERRLAEGEQALGRLFGTD